MGDTVLLKRLKNLAEKYGFSIHNYHAGGDFITAVSLNEVTIAWYSYKKRHRYEGLTLNFNPGYVSTPLEALPFYRELIPSVTWRRFGSAIRWKTPDREGWESCMRMEIQHGWKFVWHTGGGASE